MVTILIVEDEAAVLVLAESVLQHAGYETVSAATLAEAKSILASEQHLDLIFTDITLRDEIDGGVELGQYTAQSRPTVPVLYTTGRVLTDGMHSQLVENSSALGKPYTDEQLIGAISDLLKRK